MWVHHLVIFSQRMSFTRERTRWGLTEENSSWLKKELAAWSIARVSRDLRIRTAELSPLSPSPSPSPASIPRMQMAQRISNYSILCSNHSHKTQLGIQSLLKRIHLCTRIYSFSYYLRNNSYSLLLLLLFFIITHNYFHLMFNSKMTATPIP